jgi:hypothetical protein
MKLALFFVVACSVAVTAADHKWQRGVWRDVQSSTQATTSMSIPIGGTPSSVVAGVTIPGTAPTYMSFAIPVNTECVTIDGPDALRYVACWQRHFAKLIVNDPIDFAVEGSSLFVRGDKKNEAFKLKTVKIIRLLATQAEPNDERLAR